jgi:hypothetical protein
MQKSERPFVKQVRRVISRIISFGSDAVSDARADIYREWDRQRARALSPSDREEIDAIFSRSL